MWWVGWGDYSRGSYYSRKPQTANRKPQTANRKPQTANRKRRPAVYSSEFEFAIYTKSVLKIESYFLSLYHVFYIFKSSEKNSTVIHMYHDAMFVYDDACTNDNSLRKVTLTFKRALKH